MAQQLVTSSAVDLDADSFSDSELLPFAPPPPQPEAQHQPSAQPGIATAISSIELLKDEKMMLCGAGYVIMSVPTRSEAVDVMAKVANVATAIQKGLETEFPTGGVTRLFGCFRVAAVMPPDQARASMDQLGHLMGWERK